MSPRVFSVTVELRKGGLAVRDSGEGAIINWSVGCVERGLWLRSVIIDYSLEKKNTPSQAMPPFK